MTRYVCPDLFPFDPKIDRTIHSYCRHNQASISDSDFDSVFSQNLFDSDSDVGNHNMAK